MARTVLPPPITTSPQYFKITKTAQLIDRFMTHFITVGGISVIVAVLGIFVFILSQILPLFQSAKVTPLKTIPLPPGPYVILGADEWTEYPFLLTQDGNLSFVDLTGQRGVQPVSTSLTPHTAFSAFAYDQKSQELTYGTADGRFAVLALNYHMNFSMQNRRQVVAEPEWGPWLPIGTSGHPIVQIAYGDGGSEKLAAVLQEVQGSIEIHAVTLTQKQSLLGAGKVVVDKTFNLTLQVNGEPQTILVNAQANGIIVATKKGSIYYFFREKNDITLRQVFTPFKNQADPTIATMDYILGGVSLIVTHANGDTHMYSLYVPEGHTTRLFGQTKILTPMTKTPMFYAASIRNKAFLIGTGSTASLYYATTSAVRWEQNLPFVATNALLGGKYNRVLFLDNTHTLHIYQLKDPHPETGFTALFKKVWYEGANMPRYVWQSTGGTDDFEPKLSLIPIIIGTLKGTFYAMLFAVPIALLAAIYTSQFLHPDLRTVVKPTMEIMASLPSVILGFLAALWLAPLLEARVPSVLLVLIFLPLSSLLVGHVWTSLPLRYRRRVRPGYEFLAVAPVVIFVSYIAWQLGPILERMVFVVDDIASGGQAADFRLWWSQLTGMRFEQRNSLVVGFMMGFAVIPIIFTITEDALSSVPPTLKSGSLALGASRWQTAIRIILPTASAGIFSAMMIGLGRAVGETMIVLMATGNTPIMDLNIFSGMRTLSANIAVELPEAPQFGTLYRTLFLGAMMLFVMTFIVNTAAEIIRQRLRERYKTI